MDIGRIDLSACSEVQEELEPRPEYPTSPVTLSGMWQIRAAGAPTPAGALIIGEASWSGPWAQDVGVGPPDVPCPIGRESRPYRNVDATITLGSQYWYGLTVEILPSNHAQWVTGLSEEDYPLGLLPELEAGIASNPAHAYLGANRRVTSMSIYVGGPMNDLDF